MHPGPNCQGWPKDRVPTEVYQFIIEYLPRDSIEAMRLVCREFENRVSLALFQSVVVPFRSEIYGMINTSHHLGIEDVKGKGKAKETDDDNRAISEAPFGIYDQKLNEGSIHQDMLVFKRWGPQIKKFAMVSEVDEEILKRPPGKVSQEEHESYCGSYKGPLAQYSRFQICAGLEQTADKSDYMTAAFSNLTEVVELGLVLDSGLGWLAGPDMSDRARLFNGKTKVFGTRNTVPGTAARKRMETWRDLSEEANIPFIKNIMLRYESISRRLQVDQKSFYKRVTDTNLTRMTEAMRRMDPQEKEWHKQYGFGKILSVFKVKLPSSSITEPRHEILPEPTWVTQTQVVCQALVAIQACLLLAVSGDGDTDMSDEGPDVADEESGSEDNVAAEVDRILEDIEWPSLLSPAFKVPSLIFGGIDFNTTPTPHIDLGTRYFNPSSEETIVPNCLTYAQKEWLLETKWAQRAFLASYTLAVMDNVTTFKNVRTFTVTKLSARYLDRLHRPGFWAALPNLATVTLIVSPDWREVVKEDEGYIADHPIAPSDASGSLYRLIQECIAPLKEIKTLTIGFIGGGEHATGMYARNKHILPGPILADPRYHVAAFTERLRTLQLPFVEHLTFTNCWFGPYALRYFVNKMRQASLHTLRLDSVSLISVPSLNPVHPILNDWLTTDPRPFSWPGIINAITPGPSIAAQRLFHTTNRRIPSPANTGALKRLEFFSCGYARLESRIHRPYDDLGAGPRREQDPLFARRERWLEPFMMVQCREEKWLARIFPWMRSDDLEVLMEAFGLEMGWGMGQAARLRPLEDGQWFGGVCRFRGVLTAEEAEGGEGEVGKSVGSE